MQTTERKTGKRVLAMLLAVLFIVTMLPVSVLAQGTDVIRFEAEDCELGGGVTTNGSIVEGMHKAGAYVQLNGVDGGAEGGEYLLTINYSTGMPDVVKALYVNGEYVKDLAFLPTDNWLWQTYGNLEVTVTLNPGAENTIRIDNGAEENAYGLNFDYFTISPVNSGEDGKRLVTYEAENGTLGGGAKVSGSAVGDMHRIGAYCEISGFDGGKDGGECELIIRYATENDVSKQVLYVNGVRQVLEFPSTGGWDRYGELKVPVTLNGGYNNVIRIQREDGVDEKETGINIDKFSAYVVGKMTNGDGPRYEAEYCDLGRGARIASDAQASEGAYVENLSANGAYLTESHVNGLSGGMFGLTVFYQSQSSTTKSLYVNGEKAADLSFDATGQTYRTLTTNVLLAAGSDNVLTIKNDGNTTDVQIDCFDISESRLLGLWKLNEKYDQTAADASGFGHDAALSGDVHFKPALFENGLSFKGTNGFVQIPAETSVNGTGFTVSMWVKPESNKDQTIFLKTIKGNSDAYSHMIRIRDGVFEAQVYDGDDVEAPQGKFAAGTTKVQPNTWYFVTLTLTDNGEMALYVNGNKEASTAIKTAWKEGDLYQLGCAANQTSYFEGMIDELSIYANELSEEEIRSLCNTSLNGTAVDLSEVFDTAYQFDETFAAENHVYDGAKFTVSDQENNAVSCNGQELTGFEGVYDSLRILGTGGSTTVTVTYVDRTVDEYDFTLDETGISSANIEISSEKVVKSITLPEASEVKLLAMTLVKNQFAQVSRAERIMIERDTLPMGAWNYTWKRPDHPLGEEIGNRDRANAYITTEQFMGMGLNAPVFFEEHNTYDEGLMSGPMANSLWGITKVPMFNGIMPGLGGTIIADGPTEEQWENGYLKEDQKPHTDTLYFATIGDEEGYSDALVDGISEWFDLTRNKYPDVLVSTNQYGYQWSESQMRHYIQTARPDFITFDHYAYDNGPDWNAAARLLSNTGYYRTLAMEGWDGTGREPIAFGQHVNAAEIDGTYRTESTTAAMPFTTVAIGGKWLNLFTFYTQGGYDGGHFFDEDGNPTKLYEFGANTFTQIGNLEQHLLHLRSSGIGVVSGEHMVNGVPLKNSISAPQYTPAFTENPTYYIENITAKNTGDTNDGLPGDVLIGYFDPIPEEEQFFSCESPKYFMIVNLLTQGAGNRDWQWAMENGTSEETAQEITVTFELPSASLADNLYKVNRDTGKTEKVELTHVEGNTYTYTITIGGGQGDLFFFEEEDAVHADDVVITAEKTETQRGEEISLDANVDVKWTVKGGVSDTTIDENGNLTISENETSTQLVVKAVSKVDGTNYAETIINVDAGVESVTITPNETTVTRGKDYQFKAAVNGNDPVNTVLWEVKGGTVGTTIAPNGLLTVAEDETADTLTVIAKSAADPTKTASAVVHLSDDTYYAVTIEETPNGVITADRSSAMEGETVTITVTPDEEYALKEGTLTVNGQPIVGTSFTMLAEDVVISAEFEQVVTIDRSVLEHLIELAQSTDLSKYTEQSAAVLKEALAKAIDVYDTETASQAEIDAAAEALEQALNDLVLLDEDTENPDESQVPDTSDTVPFTAPLAACLLTAGAAYFIRKRVRR